MKCFRLFLCCFLVFLITTGCWDRRELNDLAILLGWGVDINEDGNYVGTAEFIVPSELETGVGGLTGSGKGFFVQSATAESLSEATAHIQTSLSRTVFPGYRRTIVIGEKLASRGIFNIIDEYSRNPDVRLRTDMFVVRYNSVEDILNTSYHMERVPAIAAYKILQQQLPTTTTLAEFLIASNGNENTASLPVIRLSNGNDAKKIQLIGQAYFDNDLKLIGYINYEESLNREWILGKQKKRILTASVNNDDLQRVVFNGYEFTKKIKVTQSNEGKFEFKIFLSGKGRIIENNSNIDLKKSSNIHYIENELNKQLQSEVSQVMHTAQTRLRSDIFNLGGVVHREFPSTWRKINSNWNEIFSNSNYEVEVRLTVEQTGLVGIPLQEKGGAIR